MAVVEVTQEDIASGRLRSATSCPVAHAISRAFSIPASVAPHWWTIADAKYAKYQSSHLPDAVSDWIKRFDRGERVEPFTFETQMPPVVEGAESDADV